MIVHSGQDRWDEKRCSHHVAFVLTSFHLLIPAWYTGHLYPIWADGQVTFTIHLTIPGSHEWCFRPLSLELRATISPLTPAGCSSTSCSSLTSVTFARAIITPTSCSRYVDVSQDDSVADYDNSNGNEIKSTYGCRVVRQFGPFVIKESNSNTLMEAGEIGMLHQMKHDSLLLKDKNTILLQYISWRAIV